MDLKRLAEMRLSGLEYSVYLFLLSGVRDKREFTERLGVKIPNLYKVFKSLQRKGLIKSYSLGKNEKFEVIIQTDNDVIINSTSTVLSKRIITENQKNSSLKSIIQKDNGKELSQKQASEQPIIQMDNSEKTEKQSIIEKDNEPSSSGFSKVSDVFLGGKSEALRKVAERAENSENNKSQALLEKENEKSVGRSLFPLGNKEVVVNNKEVVEKEKTKEIKKEIYKERKKEIEKKKSGIELHKEAVWVMLGFAKILQIEPDHIWRAREIKFARRLLQEFHLTPEQILNIVAWRLQDDYWRTHFSSLGSIISHYTDWKREATATRFTTFSEYLDRHPEIDYRKIPYQQLNARLKAFFVAFNKALKAGVIFSEKDWEKYQNAVNILKKEKAR
jgi:hypothetical protein